MTPPKPPRPDPLDDLAKRAGELPRAAPVEREPTLVKGFPGPRAPGTRHPLPPRQEPPKEALGPKAPDYDSTLDSPAPPNVARDPRRSVSPVPWEERPTAVKRAAERMGDRVVPAPESAVSPSSSVPPSIGAVRVQVGDVDVRVGSSVARRVLPWLAPVALSLLGTVVGYAKGYFEGLAAAGRRVAAIEESVKINAEDDARRDVRAKSDVDRAFVLIKDHDARIPKLEDRLDKAEQRLPKIEGLAPKK